MRAPLTAAGRARLRAELEQLKSVKRPAVIDCDRRGARARRPEGERRVPRRARAAGLHRRPHQAARRRAVARAGHRRVASSMPARKVVFGASVELADVETDEEKRYQIVGDLEADIKLGLIAISSPVARALIGKHEGDSVDHRRAGRHARVRDRRRRLRRLTACRLSEWRRPRCCCRLPRAFGGQRLSPMLLLRWARADRSAHADSDRRAQLLPPFPTVADQAGRWRRLTRQRRCRRCRDGGLAARGSGATCGPTSTARACWPTAMRWRSTTRTRRRCCRHCKPLFGDAGFFARRAAAVALVPAAPARCEIAGVRRCRSEALGEDLFDHLPEGEPGTPLACVAQRSPGRAAQPSVECAAAPRTGKPPVNALWFWGAGVLPDAVRTPCTRCCARTTKPPARWRNRPAWSSRCRRASPARRTTRSVDLRDLRDLAMLVDAMAAPARSLPCATASLRWLELDFEDGASHADRTLGSAGASGANRSRRCRSDDRAHDQASQHRAGARTGPTRSLARSMSALAAPHLQRARRDDARRRRSRDWRTCCRRTASAASMPRPRCWPTPSPTTTTSSSSATSTAMAPRPARSACAACACSARRACPTRCPTAWCTATACRRRWSRNSPRWQPDLLVTVDHGIACHAGIAAAKARGWQVLVTDHHLPGERLPPADAIVDPNLPGDALPQQDAGRRRRDVLRAAGVASAAARRRAVWRSDECRSVDACSTWSPSAPSPTWCRWTPTTARWSRPDCGGCAPGSGCAGLQRADRSRAAARRRR